mgnify:CR=1 FL=1
MERKDTGVWIRDLDLLDFFDSLQVLYNPNLFPQKTIENIESQQNNSITLNKNE